MTPHGGGTVRGPRAVSHVLTVLSLWIAAPALAGPVDERVAALAEIADGGLYVLVGVRLGALGVGALPLLVRCAGYP